MMTFTYMDVYLPSFMKDIYNSIQLRKPEGVEITLDACSDIIFNIDGIFKIYMCFWIICV